MSTANDLRKSYSGIFGNQVTLKCRRGKVVMTIPAVRKAPKPTPKQIDYRRRFLHASRCATNVLKDPEMLAAYRKKARKGQTAYNLALRDFLRPPGITKIDPSGYLGTVAHIHTFEADPSMKTFTNMNVRQVKGKGVLEIL